MAATPRRRTADEAFGEHHQAHANLPQIETTTSHTKTQWIHFSHRWTIDEFSTRCRVEPVTYQPIESPSFGPSAHKSIRFYMELFTHHSRDRELFKYVALYLYYSPSWKETNNNRNKRPLISKFEFSILDVNGNKCNVCTSQRHSFVKDKNRGWHKFIEREKLLAQAGKLLPGNKLTILCEVSCMIDIVEQYEQPNQELFHESRELTLAHYAALLKSGRYSDLMINVAGNEFHLHKNILAIRSPVFAAMFESPNSSRFTLKLDVRVETFKAMLEFIYTGKLTSPSFESNVGQLFQLADLYSLTDLKQICEQWLISKLSIVNAVQMLVLAYQHHGKLLIGKVIEFIRVFEQPITDSVEWKLLAANQTDLYDFVMAQLRPQYATKRPRMHAVKKEQHSFSK